MTIGLFPGLGLGPAAFVDSVPLKRAGTEEVRSPARRELRLNSTCSQEMAGAILFLASRSGAYVNGAVWLVDGGRVGSVASSY
jgi:NAD(P)-dependent dehydrogenase (short-subunit alcohol dehydrogenase family)